jgi:thioredoxin 1
MNFMLRSGFTLMILTFLAACGTSTSQQVLDAKSFSEKLAKTQGAIILDVRSTGEFDEAHMKGAVNLNFSDGSFEQAMSSFDKSKPYFVYCLSGGRSKSAAEMLRKNGFMQVYELEGGLLKWKAAGLTLEEAPPVVRQIKGMSMEEYETLIKSHPQVLVDFYAPWCRPCMQMKPDLEALEKKYGDNLKLVRIDVDQNPDLSGLLRIEAIPVIRVFRDGKETWNHVGYADKETMEAQLKR